MTTGEAIKNARIKANMTQAALAEKLNVTPQNISQYERDIKNPKIETLQKIASALDILLFTTQI
jgi:transcriptional regulator with XRE-family HTH domain